MLKKLATTGVVAAAATGAIMFSSPAYADAYTSGDASVLGGTQTIAPIQFPIVTCGNAVPVVGNAVAGCKGGGNVGEID